MTRATALKFPVTPGSLELDNSEDGNDTDFGYFSS